MRILLAEDEAVARLKLEKLLTSWGYDVASAADGAEAWNVMRHADAPSVAILDWLMPKLDGVDVCRMARKAKSQAYIILLTAKAKQDDVVAGVEAGADDYLIKPVDNAELRLRLAAAKRILDLQEQLSAARDELRTPIQRDPLTGLPNRGTVIRSLQRKMLRTQRADTPVSVLLCDLDHFSKINDEHGRTVGDEVLRLIGQRLFESVHHHDEVGRYGGEEFLSVLADCNLEQASLAAERARRSVEHAPVVIDVPGAGAVSLPITISIGVACTSQVAEKDLSGLLMKADLALTQAKREGRNRVVPPYSNGSDSGAAPVL